MSSVGFATLQIVPSLKGIEQSINSDLSGPLTKASAKAGEDSGHSFSKGLTSTLTSAAGAVAKAATIGFAAAGAAVVALGAFGVKAAADFQQTQIAFEGIFGSAQKANDFLKELQQFAAKTPFEFPELQDSAKNLLAVGFNAKDVIPIMTKLGNVAATLGVGGPAIEGVVRALGQMKGKGKASAEELNQISEQIPGFSAVGAIAEKLGVSVADAFKMMEKGAVPADIAIQAILEGMEKFPGAAGAMERQSKTLNGVISTFKDNFRQALVEGITPFLPALSEALTKATPLITGALKEVVGGITALVAAFKDGGKDVTSAGFAGVLERVGLALRAVVDFFRDNSDTIKTVVTTIVGNLVDRFKVLADFFMNGIVPALKPVFAAIKDALPDLLKLSDAANDISLAFLKLVSSALKPILPILGNVIALIIRFAGVVARNKDVVLALVAAFLAFKAVGVITSIIGGISTAFKSLQAAIFLTNALIAANPIGAIVIALIALGAAVVIAYREFKPFHKAVDAVWQALQVLFDFVIRNWKTIGLVLIAPFLPFIALAALVIANWQKVVDFFAGIGAFIADAFNSFINSGFGTALIDFVTSTFNNIVQVVTGVLDILRGILKVFTKLYSGEWGEMWDGIKQVVQGVWEVISGIIQQGINLVSSILKIGFEAMKAVVSNVLDNIVQFFLDLPGRIISTIVSIAKAAVAVGKAIIQGIADGITGAVSFAVDFAKDVGNAVIKFINDHVLGPINDALEFQIGLPFGAKFDVNPPDIHIAGFAQGGIVPGPKGQPLLAIVHGGEEITPVGETKDGKTSVINVFGRSDDDMLRKLAIEQRRAQVLA